MSSEMPGVFLTPGISICRAIPQSSGGRTRLSGVFEGAFALAAFLFFGSLIAWVPIAAPAGILIVVAFRMIDWHSLHLLRSRSTRLGQNAEAVRAIFS